MTRPKARQVAGQSRLLHDLEEGAPSPDSGVSPLGGSLFFFEIAYPVPLGRAVLDSQRGGEGLCSMQESHGERVSWTWSGAG
jgi:hypothetical protein